MTLANRNIEAHDAWKAPSRNDHIIQRGEGARCPLYAMDHSAECHALLDAPLPISEGLQRHCELEALRAGEEANLPEIHPKEWDAMRCNGGGGAEEGAVTTK